MSNKFFGQNLRNKVKKKKKKERMSLSNFTYSK